MTHRAMYTRWVKNKHQIPKDPTLAAVLMQGLLGVTEKAATTSYKSLNIMSRLCVSTL